MEPVIIKVGYLVQAGGGNLPAGTEGQFVGYGAEGVPVAVDAPVGGGYDDTALSGRVDDAQSDATEALQLIAALPAAYDDAELRGIATSAQSDASDALTAAAAAQADADANAQAIADLPAPYDDTAVQDLIAGLEARIAALENGTPPEPETAPTLTGGSLTVA